MDTPLKEAESKFYILPTKELLKGRTMITPEEAASKFLHGVSMDEFIIAGNANIMIV